MNEADHSEASPAIDRAGGGVYATQENDAAPAEADAAVDRSHAADLLGSEALRLDKGDLFRRIARNLDAFRQDSSWARSRSQTEAEGGDPAPAEPEPGESPSAIATLNARVEAMGQSLDALHRSVAPRLAQVQNAELAPLQALVDAVVGEMQRLKRRPPVAPMPMLGTEMSAPAGSLPSPIAPPLSGPSSSAMRGAPAESTGPIAEAQRVDDPGDAKRRRAGGSTLRRALIGVAWAVPVVLSGTVLLQRYQGRLTEAGTATSRPAAPPAAAAKIVPPAADATPRVAKASTPAAPSGTPAPVASAVASAQRTEPPAASDAKPAQAVETARSSGSVAPAPQARTASGLTPRSWVDWAPKKTPAAAPTIAPAATITPAASPTKAATSGPKVIGPAGGSSIALDAPAVSAAALPPPASPVPAPRVLPIASPSADTSQDGGVSSPPPVAKHAVVGTQASASSSGVTPAAAADHPAVAVPAPAGPKTAAAAPVPVQIRTTADAWVQVRDAKGAIVFGRLMHAGESWTVPDRPGLLLTTGNAGGTELVIGGIVSAPLGATGVVRHDVPLNAGGISGAGGMKPVGPVGGATSG